MRELAKIEHTFAYAAQGNLRGRVKLTQKLAEAKFYYRQRTTNNTHMSETLEITDKQQAF